MGSTRLFIALIIIGGVGGLSGGCAKRYLTADEFYASKSFEAAPSVVTPAQRDLVRDPSYVSFVSKWMRKLDPAPVDRGAFSAYRVTVRPPTTRGFRAVGGRELTELGYVLRNWCKQNGGTVGRRWLDDDDDGQALDLQLANAKRQSSGNWTTYCQHGTHIIAALSAAYSPRDQQAEPVVLQVQHYTEKSIAAARDEWNAELQRKAEVEREAARDKASKLEATVRRMLDAPSPWGVALGVDTPRAFASKVGVDLSKGRDCGVNSASYASVVCWKSGLGRADVIETVAHFADIGAAEPVLEYVGVTFAPQEWSAIYAGLEGLWGPEDVEATDSPDRSEWGWGSGPKAQLSRFKDGTLHFTLYDFTIGRLAEARRPLTQMLGITVQARPWEIQLGVDSMQSAMRKLDAVGFNGQFGSGSCMRSYPKSKTRTVVSCQMKNPKMRGLDSAAAEFVDIGGRTALISELSYRMAGPYRGEIIQDLEQQYGAPLANFAGHHAWRVGSVDISVSDLISDSGAPGDVVRQWFIVQYKHGRLWQLGYGALVEDANADRDERRPGL